MIEQKTVEKTSTETDKTKPEVEATDETEVLDQKTVEATEDAGDIQKTGETEKPTDELSAHSADTEQTNVDTLIENVSTLTAKVEAELLDTSFEDKSSSEAVDQQSTDNKQELSEEEKTEFLNKELYKQF